MISGSSRSLAQSVTARSASCPPSLIPHKDRSFGHNQGSYYKANPAIPGVPAFLTASLILSVIADDLLRIKIEDKLRWTDIGSVLGKGNDQAARYADGSADMGLASFVRGKLAWGSRFTGSLDRLVGQSFRPIAGAQAQTLILQAALAMSASMENGELTAAEIQSNKSTLEVARDAIDAQLSILNQRANV